MNRGVKICGLKEVLMLTVDISSRLTVKISWGRRKDKGF
jgi:hypothetical protein